MIELQLPWPPTTNNLYTSYRSKSKGKIRRLLSPEAKAYKGKVAWICRSQLGSYEPLKGRIHMAMKLHAPNERRCDLDNRLKIVQDALTDARVWIDDEQIDSLSVMRGPVSSNGGCVILAISEIP